MGFEKPIFHLSDGVEEGSLLDIRLFNLAIRDERGEEMGDTLIGDFRERCAFRLDFLDGLGHIRRDKERDEFSFQVFVLNLSSRGLARSRRLTSKQSKLVFKPVDEEIRVFGVGGLDEIEQRGEEVALGELGRRSGGHSRLLKR